MQGKEKDILDFSISFSYEESRYEALKDVEGKVEKGRCIVLTGPSGCGKSTLLRAFNHLIPDFHEGNLKGSIHICGKDSSTLSIGETGKLASSVFQDPRSQFFTLSSSTEIAFGLENFGYSHEEMVEKVDETFRNSGLERLRDRNVFELSSGERQLIAILSSEALGTDVMLLDEPTANLDAAAIENLRTLLLKLKRNGKTLIISEHRLYYLSGLADEYWIMSDGEIDQKLSSGEMLALTEEELSGLGLRTTDQERIVNRANKVVIPEVSHTFSADDIKFSYRKTSPILSGLSIEAKTGDVIGIVGPNGCGKTTFGKIASGLEKGFRGTISLDGRSLKQKKLSRASIFIMQEAEFQFFSNSVLNELEYFRRPKDEQEEIRKLLKDLDMWKTRSQHPFSLSGGQMQKLVLLLAYLSPKPIVFLDEPTAGLDRESLEKVSFLIHEMARKKIVFIITHDLELLSLAATKAVSMKNGRIASSFDLTRDTGFDSIRSFMKTGLIPEEREIRKEKQDRKLLDPRTKFFIFLVAAVVGIYTDFILITFVLAGVLLAALYEKRWGIISSSILSMLAVILLYGLWPNVGTSFILNFFPRIILTFSAAAILVQKSEASRSLAAARAMHIPESWIMVLSVMFRFFPVLNKDLGMMNQSIRTRGFFPRLSDRLKSIPKYAEILIVPMVFRVTRIAEALSASAETRGIALKGRRESYISTSFHKRDLLMAIAVAVLLIVGMII